MGKSKRNYRKNNKSKKIRKGGRKNNQNQVARISSQMYGGSPFSYNTLWGGTSDVLNKQSGGQAAAPAPGTIQAPAPASLLNLANLNEQSVINALQSFGDAANTLQYAVLSGSNAASNVKAAATAQLDAFTSLNTSVTALYGAIANDNKLWNKIVGTTFHPSPIPPAPAPA